MTIEGLKKMLTDMEREIGEEIKRIEEELERVREAYREKVREVSGLVKEEIMYFSYEREGDQRPRVSFKAIRRFERW